MGSRKSKMMVATLVGVAMLAGVILASVKVMADNGSVVVELNITVPVACTLGGTGTDSHNATINNGQ